MMVTTVVKKHWLQWLDVIDPTSGSNIKLLKTPGNNGGVKWYGWQILVYDVISCSSRQNIMTTRLHKNVHAIIVLIYSDHKNFREC